jgi:hypothetical protein
LNEITKGQTLQTGIPRALLEDKKAPDTYVSSQGHPLDSQQHQERLRHLMSWRRQARIAQADNRTEMARDEDFYDGIQLEPEDLYILAQRNQPALVFNVIKNTINWILGTEKQARIDSRVLPRNKSGAQAAKSKTKMMKYTQDVSKGEYERSFAFEECIKAGVGWLENGVRSNGDEPIFMRAECWRNVWYDHLGRSLDGSDWRFLNREKWVDLDIAQNMFPERAERLRTISEGVNSIYPYLPDDTVISDSASEFDLESDLDALFGGSQDGKRERVKLIEMWYRVPNNVKILKRRDNDTPRGALDGAIFRADEPDHQYLVRGGYFTTTDARILTVRQAIWSGNTLLQDILSPYNHNQFPLTPMFCYRRRRDNLPYGMIRDIRDPQSDLNKRRSRALVLLTANRVIADKGAVDDKKEAYEELNRPDGWVEVKPNARFEIQKEQQLAQEHVELARDDERFVDSISGITKENKGTIDKSLSGKAIANIQAQGHTTSGVAFDNYYYAAQVEGEKRLSLIEQFIDQPKEYRITGNQQNDEFISVNDGTIENDITRTKADFIIGKQDFKESIRQSMLAMLVDLVSNLSQSVPQVALGLLDMVVDLMDDLPGKDEIVARIRKINGQNAPEDDMSPEEKDEAKQNEAAQQQKQAQQEQIQQAMMQITMAAKQAEADGKKAKADRDKVEAAMTKLDGFLKALEVAGTLNQAPGLAKAADAIFAEAAAAPIDGDQQQDNQPAQQL